MLLSQLLEQLEELYESIGDREIVVQIQPGYPLQGGLKGAVAKSDYDEDTEQGSSDDQVVLLASECHEYGDSAAYDFVY